MGRLSPRQRYRLYRLIYEVYMKNPRIKLYELAKYLGVVRNTAADHKKRAYEQKILFPPQLRLKMFAEVKEYVYALKADNAFRVYEELKSDPRVCYQVLCRGRFDLLVTTSFPLDDNEIPHSEIAIGGSRSNYIIPFIPDIDFRISLERMQKKVRTESISSSTWDVTYPHRDIIWTNRDWDIFQLLRNDVSTKYTRLAAQVPMHYDTFSDSLERIFANTAMYVPYYPKGYDWYVKWILMAKSHYEYFLIDLLSCIPCTTVIYKVADWLIAHIKVAGDKSGDFLRFFYGLENQGYMDMFDIASPALYWYPEH
jgi:hypothetical protein